MPSMLYPEVPEAPQPRIRLDAATLQALGYVSPPPAGTEFCLEADATVLSVAPDGSVELELAELELTHEMKEGGMAAVLYPGMA